MESTLKQRTFNISLLILISICYCINDIVLVKVGPIFLYAYRYSLLLAITYLAYKKNWKINIPKRDLSKLILIFYLFLFISMFSKLSFQPSKVWFSISLISAVVLSQTDLTRVKKFIENKNLVYNVWLFLTFIVLLQQLGVIPNQGIGIQRSTKLYVGFYERLDFIEIFLLIGHFIFKYKRYHVLIMSSIVIIITGSFSGIILLSTLFLRMRLRVKSILFSITALLSVVFLVNQYQHLLFDELELINREKRVESKFGENFFETNWRLISSIVVIEDFINNPTLLGHGYNSHAYLVKPYYWNKENDTYATAHTFTSILYDQGIIGFLIISFLLWHLARRCYLYWKFNHFVFLYVTLAVLMRFLVYHQSIFPFMAFLLIIIIENENSIGQLRIPSSARRCRHLYSSPSTSN